MTIGGNDRRSGLSFGRSNANIASDLILEARLFFEYYLVPSVSNHFSLPDPFPDLIARIHAANHGWKLALLGREAAKGEPEIARQYRLIKDCLQLRLVVTYPEAIRLRLDPAGGTDIVSIDLRQPSGPYTDAAHIPLAKLPEEHRLALQEEV